MSGLFRSQDCGTSVIDRMIWVVRRSNRSKRFVWRRRNGAPKDCQQFNRHLRSPDQVIMLESTAITCPYCWELIEVPLETEPGNHVFVEDCPVCCQPILLRITVGPDGELQHVESSRENE
jgi:hypothetical protein